MVRFWRLNLTFVLAQTIAGIGLAQDQPFIVSTGPEGRVITSFQRDGQTQSLVGWDSLQFVDTEEGVYQVDSIIQEATGELIKHFKTLKSLKGEIV